MGHIVNGDVGIAEGSGKRMRENGGGVSLDAQPVKFKRRRVSAVRDFPPRCGRFAEEVFVKSKENGVSVGSVKNSTDEVEDGVLESSSVKPSESCAEQVDVKSKENGAVVDSIEKSNVVPDGLVESSFDRPLDSSVENKSFDVTDSLVPKELPLIHIFTMPLEDSAKAKVLKPINNSEPVVVETVPMELPVTPVLPNKQIQLDESDELQSSVSVAVMAETIQKKYPPRRKKSAVRDFPPGCGRNAAPVNKEEFRKLLSSSKQEEEKVQAENELKSKMKEKKEIVTGVQTKSKEESKKEKVEQVNVKEDSKIKLKTSISSPRENGTPQPDSAPSKRVDRASGSSGGKSGLESVKPSKDTSVKRKFPGKNESRPSLDSSSDRVIVQCLMARTDCPWTSGKKASKPASVIKSQMEPEKKPFKSESDTKSETDQETETVKSPEANQSQVVEQAGLDLPDERVIVQSLMAAPNCPWRHGKKAFKFPSGRASKQRKK